MTDEEVASLASAAKLDRALAIFPNEVLAAAGVAEEVRRALGRVDDPDAEPWTAMPG